MNKYEVKAGLAEVEPFDVVGISTITDNVKGADDINALWERFFKESVGQHVPNKIDDTIYAVYSDYQGDHEAPYRLTIGYRVNSSVFPANDDAATSAAPNPGQNASVSPLSDANTADHPLSGANAPLNSLSNKNTHPGKDTSSTPSPLELHYVKCIGGDYAVMSAAGEQPKALIETWKAIWSAEDLGRAFQTDFEIYGSRFFEDGVNEVLVHIGLK